MNIHMLYLMILISTSYPQISNTKLMNAKEIV